MIKKRKVFLDILRVSAALAVALYHVLTGAVSLDPEVPALTAKVIEALSRSLLWHVPTFLLITGFLWLSDEKECTWRKVLPGIRRFALVLATVGLGFAILERFFRFRTFSLELLSWSVLDVLIGNLWDHMWYVYAVIGIYLVLPVIKPYFQHSSVKSIGLLTGLLFILTIFIPNIEHSTGYHFPVSFPMANPAYPAFYICAGGLLSKIKLPKKAGLIGLVTFALSVCSCFAMMMILPGWVRWTNIFSGISAISLFAAVKVLAENAKDRSFVRCVSENSFGIYLFHQLFINILLKVLDWYPLRSMAVLSLTGVFVAVTLGAFLVTFLLRKIPLIRKYIL